MIYIILSFVILAINIIPAFMPSTWIILSFFYIKYHLNFIPTIMIGVSFATLGRIILANISKNYLVLFLSKKTTKNMEALGKIFELNKKIAFSTILTYTFLPIPSNQLFIAAGLAQVDLFFLSLSFFIGRSISYSFWMNMAHKVSENLESEFIQNFSNLSTLSIEIIGFLILYLISKIDWIKILSILKKRINANDFDHSKL